MAAGWPASSPTASNTGSRRDVPRYAVAEMKSELMTHLREALDEAKGPETVVGSDLAGFAETWAMEYRGPASPEAWTASAERRA